MDRSNNKADKVPVFIHPLEYINVPNHKHIETCMENYFTETYNLNKIVSRRDPKAGNYKVII